MYLQKNCKLHKFATTNSNFEKKKIISDMHHRVTVHLEIFRALCLKLKTLIYDAKEKYVLQETNFGLWWGSITTFLALLTLF